MTFFVPVSVFTGFMARTHGDGECKDCCCIKYLMTYWEEETKSVRAEEGRHGGWMTEPFWKNPDNPQNTLLVSSVKYLLSIDATHSITILGPLHLRERIIKELIENGIYVAGEPPPQSLKEDK